MVRTGVGGHIEHAAAYAGILEPLQHFSPGRHPSLDGWMASSIGVMAGIGLAHCALALHGRADGKRSAEPDAEGCTPATPRPGRGTAAPRTAE